MRTFSGGITGIVGQYYVLFTTTSVVHHKVPWPCEATILGLAMQPYRGEP